MSLIKKYEYSWGERHSVISAESWLRGYLNLRNVIGNENKNIFMFVKEGHVHTYNCLEDLDIALNSGEKILDKKFLELHLKKSKSIRNRFLVLYNKTKNANLKIKNNAELLIIFKEYQYLFDKTWAYFKVSQPEYLEVARKHLLKLIKNTNVDEIFIKLTTPIELDLIKKEEIAALKQSLNDSSEDMLWQHAEKFSWLFFNTYNRQVIGQFLKEKFNDLKILSEQKRLKRIKNIKEELENHKNEQDIILKKLDNKQINYLSKVFSALAVDRLKLKSWWGGAEFLFLPLFEEIGNRINISVEDLFMSYQVNEIIHFLEKGKTISEKTIDNRKESYAFLLDEGTLKFYEKKPALRLFNSLIKSKYIEESKKISGMIANTGTAKGRVRIIRVEDLNQLMTDMERFKQGDIMVTTMTQPTMVSLARKAAAIVTDEGGITSHASIIAREFNIPCIVGTKNATRLLKDGDLVEVDANKGIIRRI